MLADAQLLLNKEEDMLASLYLLVIYETENYNRANFAGLMRQPC